MSSLDDQVSDQRIADIFRCCGYQSVSTLEGYSMASEIRDWRNGKLDYFNSEPLSFHDRAVLAAMQGLAALDLRPDTITSISFNYADAICAERAKRKAVKHGPA